MKFIDKTPLLTPLCPPHPQTNIMSVALISLDTLEIESYRNRLLGIHSVVSAYLQG